MLEISFLLRGCGVPDDHRAMVITVDTNEWKKTRNDQGNKKGISVLQALGKWVMWRVRRMEKSKGEEGEEMRGLITPRRDAIGGRPPMDVFEKRKNY